MILGGLLTSTLLNLLLTPVLYLRFGRPSTAATDAEGGRTAAGRSRPSPWAAWIPAPRRTEG